MFGVPRRFALMSDPKPLSYAETERLGKWNSERAAGYLFDQWTVEEMTAMQRRFDWLGYVTKDGRFHNGRRAVAAWVNGTE